MMNLLVDTGPVAAAVVGMGVGLHILKLLGTLAFSALVIWLVIRILKED